MSFDFSQFDTGFGAPVVKPPPELDIDAMRRARLANEDLAIIDDSRLAPRELEFVTDCRSRYRFSDPQVKWLDGIVAAQNPDIARVRRREYVSNTIRTVAALWRSGWRAPKPEKASDTPKGLFAGCNVINVYTAPPEQPTPLAREPVIGWTERCPKDVSGRPPSRHPVRPVRMDGLTFGAFLAMDNDYDGQFDFGYGED
jgi:hypothetical protein